MKHASKLAFAAIAAAVAAFSACAEDTIDITEDWQISAVKAAGNADKSKPLPEGGEWKPGKLTGKIPLANGAKGGNSFEGDYNAWYRKTVDVPADWKGSSVRYEQQLNWCSAVVFVNGKCAGVAHFPDGAVELAPFLKFGGSNEIKIFATNRGYGTGEKGVVYRGRGDWGRGFGADHFWRKASLVRRSAAFVDDVYAVPSWREKKLKAIVEAESLSDGKAEIEIVVAHENGKVAVSKKAEVELKRGSNAVDVEIPFKDAEPWELVPGAKLYTCKANMRFSGASCDDRRGKFLFGFREIWLEGKDVMMNGHVQRFRGFWNQGVPKNLADLHKYGYNLSYETHKHWAVLEEDSKVLEAKSRAGVAVFAGMPTIVYAGAAIRHDPDMAAQWRRCLKHWMRTARNWPCVVAVSCGVNQICPERNMRPEFLGQERETNGVAQNIEFARVEARKVHPNCLYFSHADGTEADMSSSNLYFNFTPLQEREEWLSQWATNGVLPWYAAEFGAPYYACWFHSRVPEMTEWLAVYYGERAYESESDEMLRLSGAFAKSCLRNTHGGWVEPGRRDLYAFSPLAEEYSRMLVYRTNRAWRRFGLNGGLMYLTSWKWDEPNAMRDRQMLANGDIVCWLGGGSEPTDRTHAYRSGDEIAKRLVFVWDGLGENSFTAEWKFVDSSGKKLAGGTEKVTLRQGETRDVAISVVAPKVSRRESFRFEVAFSASRGMDLPANATCKTDSFDVEVHPAAIPSLGKSVALFDPEGETAKALAELGVKVESFDTIESALAAKPKFLVVGMRALSRAQGLEKAVERIEDGMKLLVMQQRPDVWKALGFSVEDSMARQMYNVALRGVDDLDLAHWAGAPIADAQFGNVMKHDTRRGPRWTHTHAVSSTPILIPQRAGIVPLVRGEFDMSYSALLKERRGKGAAYFCAFDFEGRVGRGGCAAATAVFASTLEEFFSKEKTSEAKVYFDGAAAERIAKTLGLDAKKYEGGKISDAVLVVGKDSALAPDALKKALGGNAHALVVANAAISAALGGASGEAKFLRAKDFPVAGVGKSLLRFREEVDFVPLKGGAAFALVEGGKILLDQIDPFQAGDRYRTGDGKAAVLARGGWGSVPKGDKDLLLRSTSQSEDNFMRRYSIVLASWGVQAGASVFARSLYTKPSAAYDPIAQYNVLGPWPSPRDDDHYMVDTIFPVDKSKGGTSGAEAEAMAVRGDVQPNPRFYPEGLVYLNETPADLRFVDWRPVAKSREDGFVDYSTAHPLIAAQAFCTCYCVGFLPRRTDGEVTVRFGVDWRGKIWINGKPFDPIYGGHKDEGSVIYEHVKLWGMPPAGTDLAKFDREHGTFDGKNVFTIKAGCGMSAKTFWLNVSHEPQEGEVVRSRVPELDGVELYESANTRFDPYEYVYW